MEESHKHEIEWMRQDTKGYTLYHSIYIKHRKKAKLTSGIKSRKRAILVEERLKMGWGNTGGLFTFCFLIWVLLSWGVQSVRFHWPVHLRSVSFLCVYYTSIKIFFKKRKKSRGEWFLVLIPGLWRYILSLLAFILKPVTTCDDCHCTLCHVPLCGHLPFYQEVKHSFPKAPLPLDLHVHLKGQKWVMYSLLIARKHHHHYPHPPSPFLTPSY